MRKGAGLGEKSDEDRLTCDLNLLQVQKCQLQGEPTQNSPPVLRAGEESVLPKGMLRSAVHKSTSTEAKAGRISSKLNNYKE